MQVVPVADEARVGANAHDDECVAAVSALEACVPLAPDPDPLAVVDACGHLDLERALYDATTLAVAVIARRIEHAAEAAALGASLLMDELPEDVLRDPPHEPGAAAGGALPGTRARLGSASRAALARNPNLDGNRRREAGERFIQVDLDDGVEIGAAGRPTGARRGSTEEILAEERGKDVREVAEVRKAGLEASAPEARVPEAVVQRAALRIREHLVRLGNLPEALLGVRRGRHVRMELACEGAKRLLDLDLGGTALDAEDLVVVALRRCHGWPSQASSYTSSTNRLSSYAAALTVRIALS